MSPDAQCCTTNLSSRSDVPILPRTPVLLDLHRTDDAKRSGLPCLLEHSNAHDAVCARADRPNHGSRLARLKHDLDEVSDEEGMAETGFTRLGQPPLLYDVCGELVVCIPVSNPPHMERGQSVGLVHGSERDAAWPDRAINCV